MVTPDAATQQGPRPLPLFLAMLRSETAGDPERRRRALAGLAAYQRAPRPAPPPPVPTVAQEGRVRMLDHGGTGPAVAFVPSLINPPAVLDLATDNSLLRWLRERGLHPYLIDWGTPGPADADMDLGAHAAVAARLIATLPAPPLLAGYCLGGTLATAIAALVPVAGLALIAAPWRFAGFGRDARAALARLWDAARPAADRLGVVPMEMLQAGFWQLDPARTVTKFEAFGDLPPESAAARAFVTLEDWSNGGAPIPRAAARALFEDLFAADLPGRGLWQVDGRRVAMPPPAIPAIEFVATGDRIVPAASAAGLAERRDVGAGHVGMVVGRRGRALLWNRWPTG